MVFKWICFPISMSSCVFSVLMTAQMQTLSRIIVRDLPLTLKICEKLRETEKLSKSRKQGRKSWISLPKKTPLHLGNNQLSIRQVYGSFRHFNALRAALRDTRRLSVSCEDASALDLRDAQNLLCKLRFWQS